MDRRAEAEGSPEPPENLTLSRESSPELPGAPPPSPALSSPTRSGDSSETDSAEIQALDIRISKQERDLIELQAELNNTNLRCNFIGEQFERISSLTGNVAAALGYLPGLAFQPRNRAAAARARPVATSRGRPAGTSQGSILNEVMNLAPSTSSGFSRARNMEPEQEANVISQNPTEVHGIDEIREGYFCVCGKSYSTRRTRRDHIQRKVSGSKFPCGVCSTRFYSLADLKTHEKVVHQVTLTNPNAVGCRKCGQIFPSWPIYREHAKATHPKN